MKYLFLNRHAKSDWNHPGKTDFERPLNDRGCRDAPEMGMRLAKRNESIDLIVTSPAVRALTTARIIAEQINYDEKSIVEDQRIYAAAVTDLLKVVNELPNQYSSVLLFGHNPGFTDFADYLSGAGILNIPTCGICKISFQSNDWSEVSAHTGNLEYFDFPKRIAP